MKKVFLLGFLTLLLPLGGCIVEIRPVVTSGYTRTWCTRCNHYSCSYGAHRGYYRMHYLYPSVSTAHREYSSHHNSHRHYSGNTTVVNNRVQVYAAPTAPRRSTSHYPTVTRRQQTTRSRSYTPATKNSRTKSRSSISTKKTKERRQSTQRTDRRQAKKRRRR